MPNVLSTQGLRKLLARAGEGPQHDSGARIAVSDGRGHEIYVDGPQACTAALLKFLRSLESVVGSE
jgi:hypothetical protein